MKITIDLSSYCSDEIREMLEELHANRPQVVEEWVRDALNMFPPEE